MDRRLLYVCVVAFSFLSCAASWVSAGAQTASQTAPGIQDVVAKANDAVVQIRAFDGSGRAIATASGFIIPDGRVITNAHVLRDAARVDVYSLAPALLLSSTFADVIHPSLDVAVLPRISAAKTTLTLSLAAPVVGEPIIAVGSPEGSGNTAIEGTVSGVRTIAGRRLVQVTTAISTRSSGGAILNRSGQVIGMSVTSVVDGQILNFAIPATDIQAVLNNPAGKVSFALAAPPIPIVVAPTGAPAAASSAVPTAAPIAAPGTAPSSAPPTAPSTAPPTAPSTAPTISPRTAPTTAPRTAPTTPNGAPTGAPTSEAEAVRIAQAYLAAGQIAAAQTVATSAIGSYPGSAELRLVLGQILSKDKRPTEAIISHRLAISLKPTLQGPYAGIADAYVDLGLPDSVLANIRTGMANGEDKASLAKAALREGSELYQTGSGSKNRARLQTAVQFLLMSDQLRPSADAKFLGGAASFLIGQSAIAEAQANPTCPTITLAQESFSVALQNVPAGLEAYPDAAKQIISAIAQYSVATNDMARRFCK